MIPYDPNTAPSFDSPVPDPVPVSADSGFSIVGLLTLLAGAAGVWAGRKAGETAEIQDEAGNKIPALDEDDDEDDDEEGDLDTEEVAATV